MRLLTSLPRKRALIRYSLLLLLGSLLLYTLSRRPTYKKPPPVAKTAALVLNRELTLINHYTPYEQQTTFSEFLKFITFISDHEFDGMTRPIHDLAAHLQTGIDPSSLDKIVTWLDQKLDYRESLIKEEWYKVLEKQLVFNHIRLLAHYNKLFYISHTLSNHDSENISESLKRKMKRISAFLGSGLFPFLGPTTPEKLQRSYKGRGIVMTTGNDHVWFAIHFLTTLRHVLKSDLPAQVFYNGPADLNATCISLLQRFEKVEVIDLSTRLPLTGLTGWSLKPFAILASSFQETIFIDSDVLFMQDPATLFSFKIYSETGVVFFRDRSMMGPIRNAPIILENLIPYPSQKATSSRIWHSKDVGHEQESGVVVINKSTPAFYALLFTCLLNAHPAQTVMYDKFWGDKELFWIGHEMTGIPYEFTSGYPGVVGYTKKVDILTSVCGNVAHTDEDSHLLWWNSGILENKIDSLDKLLKVDSYTIDLATDLKPIWKDVNGTFCHKFFEDVEYHRLSSQQLEQVDSFKSIWRDLREERKEFEMNQHN